ncbi:mATE efflux family protein [Blautia hydrogenotrophica CAG:147]|nr:mATE efflux family protein [Blautia hydrogenotrophica CAG:147]
MAVFFSAFWTALTLMVPNLFIKIFMSPTPEVLQIAPGIIRVYGISFLLLPLNIFSTYYFQALMKPKAAFFVSVSRGMVISGLLILSLPVLLRPDALWMAMPVTELVVVVFVMARMKKYTKELSIS